MLTKSGFTLELINDIISLVPDIGCDKLVQRIHEFHVDYYLLQNNIIMNIVFNTKNLKVIIFCITNNNTSKKYSDFDNVEGYQGLCPSFNLIRECFLQYFETQLEDFFD